MRVSTLLAAFAVLSAVPASAADLLYLRRPAEVEVLARYHQQPYWRVLAACAGMHGAMVTRYRAEGRAAESAQAKAVGLNFMRAALRQARSDRGIEQSAAIDLVTPAVNEGRVLGTALLQRRPGGYTPEQVVDAMCTQASERHARAAGQR